MIRVIDLQHCEIDGAVVGAVADACANYTLRAEEIQAALTAFVLDQQAQACEVVQKQLAEAVEQIQQLQTALNEARVDRVNGIEQARQSAQEIVDHFTALDATRQQQLADAQAAATAAQQDAAFQTQLQAHHWALSQNLMARDAEAAAGVFKVIRQLELARDRAALDAQDLLLKETL